MPKAQQTSNLLSSAGRPLPIVGSWNTGQFQTTQNEDKGFDPSWQAWMIRKGWPLMMSFEFFEKYRTPNMRQVRSLHYTKGWEMVKRRKLPVSFVGENWEDRFRLETQYNVMRTDGLRTTRSSRMRMAAGKLLRHAMGTMSTGGSILAPRSGPTCVTSLPLIIPTPPKCTSTTTQKRGTHGQAKSGTMFDGQHGLTQRMDRPKSFMLPTAMASVVPL
jgi:hypothetical protein